MSGPITLLPGHVALVGGGPGNPELLTVRAARLIEQADVLVYDHLVGDAVLDLARADAERIYVGKQSGKHTLPQEGINALLVTLARAGKRVVRLKGGDPYIFGRGGEEGEELAASGIPFEVVPGVTAACGAAAYAGIPLTHRDHAKAVIFVTGHLKDDSSDLDWPALARAQQTVVIYMGVLSLPEISHHLMAHGMPPDTPAACVRHATTQQQQTVAATISTLPQAVTAAGLRPPALLIIGHVVSLRDQLNWFERD
ncbi:uroporphyrinogen-III C-methyltransferase [Uliginosibacterium sp. H3]|uniref:uroporphyrinogen-III C-methyltransferase n=1 Tax=Uliginosibacterium silvisoli TaxID=3114758 RepID=A0ABU6K5Z9_9RHOO|nr:uroporphyrinogen-III C-methyltransferase [Uliginosibacterium sp. H3]